MGSKTVELRPLSNVPSPPSPPSPLSGAYVPEDSRGFFLRRSDFHGLNLTGMVNKKAPFLTLRPGYKKEAGPPLVLGSGAAAYDVTGMVQGTYPDLLDILTRGGRGRVVMPGPH